MEPESSRQLSLFAQPEGPQERQPRQGLVNKYVNRLRLGGEAFFKTLGALQDDRKARGPEIEEIARGLGTELQHQQDRERAIDVIAQAGAQPSPDDVQRYATHMQRRDAMGLPAPTADAPVPDPCLNTMDRIQQDIHDRNTNGGPRR